MNSSDSPHDDQHQSLQTARPKPWRRLMGMETEYAVVVADRQDFSLEDLPPAGMVYEQIVDAIRRTQPAASGIYDRDQWFLASGPAVTLETHPSLCNLPGGLIEIATPEVHTATELLECQTAIDRLVAEAARDSETGFDLRVLKNSSDALGHVYGCQENYQCEVARGWTLLIYRVAMMCLMAMQLISQLLSLPCLAIIISIGMWQNRRQRNDQQAPRGSWQDDQGNVHPPALPPTYIRIMTNSLRLLHYPMVIGLRQICKRIAFRRHQKFLTAHLISRIALSGGGHLETDGRYVLSPKSMVTDAIADMGGFDGERPIYVFGHWLSLLCARSFLSPRIMFELLNRNQRMQIGLSDSNLAQSVTLFKFGSTGLILDMIERGKTSDFPVLKHPLQAIRALGEDWNLVRRVSSNRGEVSALDIQRMYLTAVEAYVATLDEASKADAEITIRHWRKLLSAASAFRRDANDTQAAIGHIDWLTKRVLIDSLGPSATWPEKKKIDLRYHELSDDGYYQQLAKSIPSLQLVDETTIDQRRRSAPPGTRAIRRGAWIREFADGESNVRAEWTHGQDGKKTRQF